MRNTIASLFLFISTVFTGYSQPRTYTEVQNIASEFYKRIQGTPATRTSASTFKLAHKAASLNIDSQTNNNVYYYVFNAGSQNGFVIISGDKRAKEILGYSFSGDFSIDSIPKNLQSWLSGYQKEIQYLMNNSEESTLSTSTLNITPRTSDVSSVLPMLGQTKWDQGSPYNLLCPKSGTKSTYTGCVATAVAQIMKYHQYPITGIGKKSYTSETLNKMLTVDFSTTTYDWANMTDTYGSTSTTTQKNAVATLMYHCGVAASMDYGTDGSAAYDEDAAIGLIKYFGYDSNLRTLYRDYYTAAEWEAILKNELINGRPVLYGGGTINGDGHAFVCDGYNTDNLYHFNWGWSGYGDGYYTLTSLNPENSTDGGYTVFQDMTIGIQKPSTTSTPSYQILLNDESEMTFSIDAAPKTTFNLTVPFYNAGITSFTGKAAIGIYQDNNLAAVLGETDLSMAGFDNGYFEDNTINYTGLALPTNIGSGAYQIYSIYKGNDETTWSKMRALQGKVGYFNIQVENGIVAMRNDSSTGISSPTNNSLTIYPNPTTDYLCINSVKSVNSIEISDLSGKQILLLKPLANGLISVPVSSLANGVYLIRINMEGAITTNKFIKK
ncbi:thiol protease/hemagglutinin PrtT [Bacteroides sedimenti]|uniref:T9SS type A sorting domain-containing protein n=1 Tax=Bacteroides sedimenti TaxID=2136147 RepID=A0ABN6Z8V1_9BACE